MAITYNVYANDGLGGPIDYSIPIAGGLTGTTWQTGVLAPGEWSFDVRAGNAFGEEQNVDVAATIDINANGQDASNIPAPPVALSAISIGGGRIRVEWSYPPTPSAQYPTGFHVYAGTGGVVSYGSPMATATASWTGTLARDSTIISGLSDGVVYAFGVRAFNVYGEETNTAAVSARAKATGPGPVQSLTLTATT